MGADATTNPEASRRADVLLENAWAVRASDLGRCRRLSEEGLELAAAAGHRRGVGYGQRNLGYCSYALGDYEAAVRELTEGLGLGRELQDRLLERDCLNWLGACHAVLGDYESAMTYAEATLGLNAALGDEAGQSWGLNNVGILNHVLGRHEEARVLHLESAAIARRLGDKVREATALINLGNDLLDLARPEESVSALREALALAVETGDRDLEVKTLVNLSDAYSRLGRPETALRVSAEALALARAIGHREAEANALLWAGRAHLTRGEPAEAEATMAGALAAALAIGARAVVYQAHQGLSEAAEAQGNLAGALAHSRTYHEVEREVRGQEADRRVRAYAIARGVAEAQAEAEIHRLRNVELARALDALREADRLKTRLLTELEAKSAALERQAREDPLTGLANRRHLESALAAELERSRRAGEPLAVAMVDVDDFKRVNDLFSHAIGDEVLRVVARLIRSSCRSYDLIARYGGEEFALALPKASADQAAVVCERLREAVENFGWAALHPDLTVTVSVGVSSDSRLSDHEKLLAAADARLYQAKRAGKNRVRS